MAKRDENALFIQGGACNTLAITNSLLEAIKECRAEGKIDALDPACRLICHQLAHLFRTLKIDLEPLEYANLTQACTMASKPSQT